MEKKTIHRSPTIVIPFTGICNSALCQDVFVYLRPESNGIAVESALMRGVSNVPDWEQNISLVYLANLPGDFLNENGVIEQHYQTRIKFTKQGKELFTPYMRSIFSDYFGVEFREAEIIGAFDAQVRLGFDEEELFSLWVHHDDMLRVNGQIIKRIGKYFIVNSDIPAILHKNNEKTDIAVMIFRTVLWGRDFYNVILNMTEVLLDANILHSESQFTHVFHYSKGPFEQILDAVGFLYDTDGNHLPLENIGFYNYLLEKGLGPNEINNFIKHPILQFRTADGMIEEKSVFHVTQDLSYDAAWKIIKSATAQVLLY